MSFSGPRSASRAYDDFIPPHQLVREEGADILLLELPGFKKEQIKVQIDNYGKIRISGQRPLSDSMRWSRFRKDYISEGCNSGDIRAKFENNTLSIVMPKFINKEIFGQDHELPTQVPKPTSNTASDAIVANGIKERETKEEREKEIKGKEEQSEEYSKDQHRSTTDEKAAARAKEETLATAKAKAAEASDGGRNGKIGRKLGFQSCRNRKILVLKLVTPVMFLVGVGLFLTYKLRSATETESLDVY